MYFRQRIVNTILYSIVYQLSPKPNFQVGLNIRTSLGGFMDISTDRTQNLTLAFLVICIACLVGVRGYVATFFNINWDEFSFLSQIYAFKTGELTTGFQTLSARLFSIFVSDSGNEALQIRYFRYGMLALQVWTGVCIYCVTRVKVSQNTGLLAVIAYLGFTFNMTSGASFRTDPIAISLLMTSLLIICRGKDTFAHHLLTGFSTALAVAITIKSVMLVPAIIVLGAGKAFANAGLTLPVSIRIGAAILIGLLLYLVIMGLHAVGIETVASTDPNSEAVQAFQKVAVSPGFFPRWSDFATAFTSNSVTLLLGGLGAFFSAAHFMKSKNWPDRFETAGYLLLAAPLASLIFYRNAFPYFYGFALAPAAMFVAIGFEAVLSRFPQEGRKRILHFGVALVISIPAISIALAKLNHQPDLGVQATFIGEVKKIFPKRVAYLDRNSIIASYETAGFFMSSWGLEKYQQGGHASFADIIQLRQPKFIIANTPAFSFLKSPDISLPSTYELRQADKDFIVANYIHHWDRVWVTGKEFWLNGSVIKDVTILIAGDYTVQIDSGSIMIDGTSYSDGDIVVLTAADHTVQALANNNEKMKVRFKWGADIYEPQVTIPYESLYIGF